MALGMSENSALTALRLRDFGPTSPSRRERPGHSSKVATGDWEMLLRGVQARLRAIVSVSAGANGASRGGVSSDHVNADVVACVDDPDELQATLTAELRRCAHLERKLVDVQAVLARSRAELAGTRHGERRARHLALHDSLTGLPNRRCFGERLDLALAQVGPAHPGLTVLYIDLDGLSECGLVVRCQLRHRDMPRRWEHGCRAAQARGHRDVLRQARANGLCVLQRTCRGSGHTARDEDAGHADIVAAELECAGDVVRVHADLMASR